MQSSLLQTRPEVKSGLALVRIVTSRGTKAQRCCAQQMSWTLDLQLTEHYLLEAPTAGAWVCTEKGYVYIRRHVLLIQTRLPMAFGARRMQPQGQCQSLRHDSTQILKPACQARSVRVDSTFFPLHIWTEASTALQFALRQQLVHPLVFGWVCWPHFAGFSQHLAGCWFISLEQRACAHIRAVFLLSSRSTFTLHLKEEESFHELRH